MTLRMLLDEDSQAKYLVNLLKLAGYDVLTGNEASLTKRLDRFVLRYAVDDNRVLLTRNCADFLELHRSNPVHPGIIAVYQDADPTKNMSYQSMLPTYSIGLPLKNSTAYFLDFGYRMCRWRNLQTFGK